MRTNKDRLVMISVQGTVAKPEHSGRHAVSHTGEPFMVPRLGGITYNDGWAIQRSAGRQTTSNRVFPVFLMRRTGGRLQTRDTIFTPA